MANTNIAVIEDAKLIYRNFSGAVNKFNKIGAKSFSILIDNPDMADKMAADGWYIKPLRKREEGDPQHWHLPVAVSYKVLPPEIILIANGKQVRLDEETVGQLDYVTIEHVDLTLRPRAWEAQGKSGIKAYLKKMYITIESDPLDEKYANMEG